MNFITPRDINKVECDENVLVNWLRENEEHDAICISEGDCYENSIM